MYQHTKRDVHNFSEPRNQWRANQCGAYFHPEVDHLHLSSLLKTRYLTGAVTGPPRKAPPNYHHFSERGKSRIGVYPRQSEVVIPPPDSAILDTRLASSNGVVFY